jgi:hypothetical protein
MFGYIDIEYDELQKYFFHAVQKKVGVCEILPRARFALRLGDRPRYNGLVCSDKMGGRQTGVAAEHCRNRLGEKEDGQDQTDHC